MNGTVNAYLADRKKLSRFNKSIWFCCVLLISKTKKKKIKKNNTLLSGNAGDEKNLNSGGRNFFSFDRCSRDILFSSLASFAFFDSCFFFCCCLFFAFWTYKYIFWYKFLFAGGRAIFTRSISEKKTLGLT